MIIHFEVKNDEYIGVFFQVSRSVNTKSTSVAGPAGVRYTVTDTLVLSHTIIGQPVTRAQPIPDML